MYISNEHFEKILEARTLLEKRYSNCFKKEDEEPIPLKLKIAKDLKKQREQYSDIPSNSIINDFLSIYSTSKEYIKCLQEPQAMRVDLEGNPIEAVSEAHKEFAKKSKPKKIKIKCDKESNNNQGNRPVITIPLPEKKSKPSLNAKKLETNTT